MEWRTARQVWDCSNRSLIMGIVNVTPDSFSDGGSHAARDSAVAHALRLIAEGADILDIGGESTRPGAEPVAADDELARVLPVVEALARLRDQGRLVSPFTGEVVAISVDTMKPEVASQTLAAGADVINDVRGLEAEGMIEACARHGAGVVVMHMRGTPRTMAGEAVYRDVVTEVADYLAGRMEAITRGGIPPEAVALDPGLGFAKDARQNIALVNGIDRLARIGRPVLIGASRKRFLGEISGCLNPADRDAITAELAAECHIAGARIHRVHHVALTRAALANPEQASRQWRERLARFLS